ncbi:major pollen allergen Bet v 1-G-like [Magnolia sinica]|uniref:major pollen allergen Bet v 1-G-like n=1 Tax=Magnolia sinica TaxID=86752 RepID=UPI0026580145|nr:major pollen allergen Bet v 1-G-like [Magnolia sinica]
MPEVIVSIDIIEGDGRVGTIKKFNFTEVIKDYRFVTDRVEVMDDEKHVLKYVVINEGGHLGTKINSMSCEFKIDPSSDGGCVTKLKII